jgi:hypothetical protein
MRTRGLGWLEIVLGIGIMTLLIRASLAAIDADANMALAIELELVLVALALTFRFWARQRWLNLDWLVCRDPALTRGAG